MMKIIDFKNVSFSYTNGEPVLKGVTFSVAEGEQVGLIGANGAGKSTLMKAALGLIGVEGEVTVAGLEMSRANLPAIRKTLGYVLQDADDQMFMPTVFEDIIFGPMNYGASRKDAEKAADDTLAKLNLSYLKNRSNHKMSGGEKRLAAIATVLAMEPKVLLMDEPTISLDPLNRRRLINTINTLAVTKIIASHDLDFILETCDRALLLSNGELAADGAAAKILQNKKLLEANNLELPLCMAGIPRRKAGKAKA